MEGMNWFSMRRGGGLKNALAFWVEWWVARLVGPGPDRFRSSRVRRWGPGDPSSRLFLVGFAFHSRQRCMELGLGPGPRRPSSTGPDRRA